MAASGLTRAGSSPPEGSRWLPTGLPRAWLRVYAAIWTATLGFAALVAVVGKPLALPARHLLELKLTPYYNAPPQLKDVLALAALNIPTFAWPLLLGVVGAHRHRLARRIADALLLACMTVNTLLVAVALGADGASLLPYIPQLPLEWAAFALGGSSWVVQRRRALTVREGLRYLVLVTSVLLAAAAMETFAVPHR